MTATWEQVQQEVLHLIVGDESGAVHGLPDLSRWRSQADWVRILGDRRVRLDDLEAAKAPPVLALPGALAALWRFNTVVVLVSQWDGSEFGFFLGRARSQEYGAQAMRGLFPPDAYGDLVTAAADPFAGFLAQPGSALKLAGRPRAAEPTQNPTALEVMALAAGTSGVALLSVLVPAAKDETVTSVIDIQERLRDYVNPSQLLKTDLMTHSLMRMVEQEVDYRLRGLSAGLWKTQTFLLAGDSDTLYRAAGAIVSSQAQEEERPGPVLEWREAGTAAGDPGPESWVRSEDVAGLFALPRRPLPGFAIEAAGEFDVPRVQPPGKSRRLAIGTLRMPRATAQQALDLPLDELRRHLLVCGVTGSGKTVTTYHVLQRLWNEHNVPWLVVEPVKGEYWRLSKTASRGGALADLRTVTLGDATPGSSNPITLNPFVFPEGIPLSTHVDMLKSVFFAGFVLYPPMPYVLEMALVRVYERKGWDLVTSDWGFGRREERFPTLSDLIETVDTVASSLGWEGEMRANVRTSLMVRLENLRRGGKGLLLDGPVSWTIDRLLDRPTVLELSAFGSDEEKAFICGLIFGLLAEHREAEAKKTPIPDDLRHVLVIEEAHRLFRKTATDQGTEGGNVRGQAVDRIAGLLTEIRSYGQGVIIVDQSPEKLAPDAIRNTGTKIIHRIVAAEDRDAVAKAANLSPAQERELAVLRPGDAVLAAEEIREPVLVHVPHVQLEPQSPKDRAAVLDADSRRTESAGGTASPLGEPCRGCNAVAGGRCGAVRAQVRGLLTSKQGKQKVVPRFWLLAAGTMSLPLDEALRRALEGTPFDGDSAAIQCAGAQIPLHTMSMLTRHQPALKQRTDALKSTLETSLQKRVAASPKQYATFQGGGYLFDTCEAWCSHPCLYGTAMNRSLELPAEVIRRAQDEMDHPSLTPEPILSDVHKLLANQLGLDEPAPIRLGVCALMFLAIELKGPASARRSFVDRVLKAYVSQSKKPSNAGS